MGILSIIAFAVALSMDGFGAGIVYGIRKIRIPVTSLTIIGLIASTAIGLSMFFGRVISGYVSARLAGTIGALILIVMGLRIILQAGDRNRQAESGQGRASNDSLQGEDQDCKEILYFKIKSLGLVIQILREPTVADMDKSGHINTKEALLLSLALAMDAVGAGFGAAMAGYSPFLTPFVVGPVSAFWVGLGVYLGKRYAAKWLGGKAAILPGWVLICLGVARVIKI